MAETTSSTAKQCLILCDSDCFCSLWNLQIFNVFYAHQKYLQIKKKKKKKKKKKIKKKKKKKKKKKHHALHGC
jgi:transposase